MESPHRQSGFCEMHENTTAILTQFNANIGNISRMLDEALRESRAFRVEITEKVGIIQDQVDKVRRASDQMGLHVQGIEREMLGNLTLVADIVQSDLSEHKRYSEHTFASLQQAVSESSELLRETADSAHGAMATASQEMLVAVTEKMTTMAQGFADSLTETKKSKHSLAGTVLTAAISAGVSIATLYFTGKLG